MYFRTTIYIIFSVCIVCAISGQAMSSPTKYYLSSNGDDNNPGSITKPWKSLKKIDGNNFSAGIQFFFSVIQHLKEDLQ